MSPARSVSARRVYGRVRVCRLWGMARFTHYARRARAGWFRPFPGPQADPAERGVGHPYLRGAG